MRIREYGTRLSIKFCSICSARKISSRTGFLMNTLISLSQFEIYDNLETNYYVCFLDDDQKEFIRVWVSTSHHRRPHGKLPRKAVAAGPVISRN